MATKPSGRPFASHRAWSLVLKPPRGRPGASIPLDQFGQRFEHRLEHTGFDPSPISAEDAVPFAVFVGQNAAVVLRCAPCTSCLRNSVGRPEQVGIPAPVQQGEADRSAPIPHPSIQSVRPRLPPNGSRKSKPDSIVVRSLVNSQTRNPSESFEAAIEGLRCKPFGVITRSPNTGKN